MVNGLVMTTCMLFVNKENSVRLTCSTETYLIFDCMCLIVIIYDLLKPPADPIFWTASEGSLSWVALIQIY